MAASPWFGLPLVMRFSPPLIFFLVFVPILLIGTAAVQFLPLAITETEYPGTRDARLPDPSDAPAAGVVDPLGVVPRRPGDRTDTDPRGVVSPAPVEGRPFRPVEGAGAPARFPRSGPPTAPGATRSRTGRVLDGQGRPIPGSFVSIREHRNLVLGSGQKVPGPRDGSRIAVTETGDFVFDQGADFVYELVIEAPQYVATAIAPEPAGPLRVVLQPSGTLLGKVVDGTTGLVIVGAQVDVVQGPRTLSLTSGSEGYFEAAGLSGFLYVLRISHPAYGPLETHGPGPAPGTVRTRTLELLPGGLVEGLVTHEGLPVSGASVSFFDRNSQEYVGSTFADEQGYYAANVLATGAVLSVVAEGSGLPRAAAFLPIPESVSPGNPTRVDVALLSPVTMTGQVVDVSDRELAGARVFLEVTMAGVLLETRDDEADAEGAFRLAGLDPRAQLTVTAFHPGFALGRISGVAEEMAAAAPVILPLRFEAVLEGRVQDVFGRPIAGAYIEALSDSGGDAALGTTSDERGVFRLSGLSPGTYDLQGLKPGYDPGELLGIGLVEGEILGDLVLTLSPR